jgi:nucleoside-diphosphate-sugar epimerase
VFDREGGKQFDYVFNCGGETRFSQEERVYELRSYGLSMTLGKEAAKRKVKSFVELSTGMVYKSDSTPRKETDKLKPWSNLAKWKLKAEEDLGKIPDLNLVVLRMAHVYGPYTSKFLSTALCMARVYQSKQKEMRWLWKEDLRTNTVHIDDMVRALWHAAEWSSKQPSPHKPAVFNVVDHGNTCKSYLFHYSRRNAGWRPAVACAFVTAPRAVRHVGTGPTFVDLISDVKFTRANLALQLRDTPPSSCTRCSASRPASTAP